MKRKTNSNMIRPLSIGTLLVILTGLVKLNAAETGVLEVNRNGYAGVIPHPFSVPSKAIVLTGDTAIINKDVYAVFYNTEDLAFNDPTVPRFQFIDRQGKTIFGIGGAAEVYGYADFRGTVNQYEFDVWKIPMQGTADQRSNIGATASQTSIFLKLARSTRFGVLTMYINSDFSGGQNGNNFKLKQAYVSVGGFTLGYARSVFSDPSATVPSIDPFGPIGTINKRNILISYRRHFGNHLAGTISVEAPTASYTFDETTSKLNQKVPDIPLNLQYTWYSGSHIRMAAILRNQPYKDLLTGKNQLVTGYGVQVSGVASALGLVDFIYQVSYGKGIGYYVKGLAGEGVDLIYSGTPGKMIAPSSFAFVTGLRFDPNPKFVTSVAFSMARLYDQSQMGGDMFRRGCYIDANAFYMPFSDFQIGIGYIHGERTNMDHSHGRANRIEAMVKYSF